MKKILKTTLFLSAVLLLVFALGPRPNLNDTVTFDQVALGSDLEAYLIDTETGIPNLKPGTEKEVIWADPEEKSKTALSIVYIHGFSATKQETRPLADNVAERLGANLYFARLKGHGRDGAGLAEAELQDWANDFAEAMAIGERLGDKIIILSTSTGSTLATWGAAKPELTQNLIGLVMISPNFELQGIATWLANIPWAETILPAVAGKHRSWEPLNENHGKWWTTAYPSKAIFPMTSMLKILKSTDKGEIKAPALFIYSPDDKVIVPEEIETVASQWGGPTELLRIESSSDPFQHVIAGDVLSPETTEPITKKIVEWIEGL